MPEGHTIHRFAKLHHALLAKRKLTVTSPQGRFVDGAKRVDGHVLKKVSAHGKHLFYEYDNKLTVHVHLGLHGDFRTIKMGDDGKPPEPYGAVRMRIVQDDTILELTGPTACETLDKKQVKALHNRLGPDVLDPKADVAKVRAVFAKRSTPVGTLLMDQSVISGIGNVYRAELLYRHKLHPKTPAKSIDDATFDRLWEDACRLLRLGVKLGMILTVDEKDIAKPARKTKRLDRYNVYKRPTCRGCGAKVMTMTLAGRLCFYCPKEQRR